MEDGHVAFYPIEIVKTEIDSVWVTGLVEQAEIITVGQGFVRDGEEVRSQHAEGETQEDTESSAIPQALAEDQP